MLLNDFPVPTYELFISASVDFQDEDLSGETSSTESVHQGIKAKRLDINFILPFKESGWLQGFLRIAQAKEHGDLKIYNITCRTAEALNIRQVRFTGRVSTSELRDQQAWRVSFSLREYLSVPEKYETRTKPAGDEEGAAPELEEQQDKEQRSYFEKILGKIDKALG